MGSTAAGVEEWWGGGERIAGADGHRYFVRVDGPQGAPWMTLLHGFPTSSWDWAPVVDRLAGRFRLLCMDFLGFGDSDKPAGYRYSLLAQADAVEAAWRHAGVTATRLVGHDYGLSVVQELLARRAEGRGTAELDAVALLNGGAIPRLHRPVKIQRLLASRLTGPALARAITEGTFSRGLCEVFARRPSAEELHQHWIALTRRDGHRRGHELLSYLEERRRHAERWEQALAGTTVPITLVWGPLDPVSGAHMLDGLRRLVPAARVVELEGVGHYPQLEAADEVAAALAQP